LHELRVFWDRTVRWQVGRNAPWSLWDWGQYHARGLPDLHAVQRVLQGLLLAGALAAAFVPRRKSPLQLAALTAALLAGFELVLTYWLYTYIPWFFGFAAIALLAPAAVAVRGLQRDAEQLDSGRPAVVGAFDDDALDPDAALGGLEANR
jgi:peptidoglycan/LPS O-acetylase OafA/YrhL